MCIRERIRDTEMDETLADNQLLMIFRSDGNAVGENRQCTITLHDFGYYQYDSEDDREGEKVVLIQMCIRDSCPPVHTVAQAGNCFAERGRYVVDRFPVLWNGACAGELTAEREGLYTLSLIHI